ncbi:MAG TPA: acylphosphatase [Terriglobia bacterium]|jgi:acylphosphatase|nr:acylphosphatase [Terriglobia bacterium]
MKKKAKKFVVYGRVQGVGFRFFAENWANRLGISGYVKNCPDGTVEALAIGDPAAIEEFKARLAEGPRSARVERIEEFEEHVKRDYGRFFVESEW